MWQSPLAVPFQGHLKVRRVLSIKTPLFGFLTEETDKLSVIYKLRRPTQLFVLQKLYKTATCFGPVRSSSGFKI